MQDKQNFSKKNNVFQKAPIASSGATPNVAKCYAVSAPLAIQILVGSAKGSFAFFDFSGSRSPGLSFQESVGVRGATSCFVSLRESAVCRKSRPHDSRSNGSEDRAEDYMARRGAKTSTHISSKQISSRVRMPSLGTGQPATSARGVRPRVGRCR